MRNRKYHLYLSNIERYFIIRCLLILRNKLILQGKYTDGVDDIIIKFTKIGIGTGVELSCLLLLITQFMNCILALS